MNIQILERICGDQLTCGISGRKTDELWVVCVNGGEQLRVGGKRILETLRLLTAVGTHNSPEISVRK